MKNTWRFIQSGYADAYTNMAFDEALLRQFSAGRCSPTLRVYGWDPAAFSVGLAQEPGEVLRLEECRQNDIPVVRRMTGGGAIFHCRELTYSLVCGKDDLGACGTVAASFRRICAFLIRAYRDLGLQAEFSIESAAGKALPCRFNAPFCFAGKEKYDILIEGKKLGGNAQKRSRGIIFQHGSIPLQSDVQAAISFLREEPRGLSDEVCALDEVLRGKIEFNDLAGILRKAFQRTFPVGLTDCVFTQEERSLADELRREKYAASSWNNFREVTLPVNEKECNDASLLEKTALA
ncbi:MAG: lipoate--protein ligase family protein [Candidatus Omnitrophota bacterium]